jgi:iron-sulfur cluster repair protein YtfE (RIC family)
VTANEQLGHRIANSIPVEGGVMTDIIDLVLQDHLDIATQLDRLQAATASRDQARLYASLQIALECHLSAEEAVLYPRIRQGMLEGDMGIDDAVVEHIHIRASMREVESHDVGSEHFHLAVAQLAATTYRHVGFEEGELLPDFYDESKRSERESLGEMFEDAMTDVCVT